MSDKITPARLSDLPRLAWTSAIAFAPSPVLAPLSWPMRMLGLLPAVLRGGCYSTDRGGMVIVAKHRPALDAAILVGAAVVTLIPHLLVVSLVLAGYYQAGVALQVLTPLFVALALVVGISAATSLVGASPPASTVGPDTPRGRRWYVSGLAAPPGGSGLEVLLLTRHIIRSLPAGAVIVAAARTPQLHASYLRMGFQSGGGRRVHLVAD